MTGSLDTRAAGTGLDLRPMIDRGGRAAPLESDPVIEAYKKDIDRTLLRENLKRPVEERLRDLVRLQRFAEEWRRAARRVFG